MTNPIDQLNRYSLFEFQGVFARLEPPSQATLRGLYRGFFVGPAWLRKLTRPLLALTGLGGWWGKDFSDHGNVANLVRRHGRLERRFPMRLVEQLSYLDGKPGLALHYAAENPFPWPWIVDELRSLEPELLLGMSIARMGPLKRLALPFVLQPQEVIDGL